MLFKWLITFAIFFPFTVTGDDGNSGSTVKRIFYDGLSECNGGGITLLNLDIYCPTSSDGICGFGDEVFVSGAFSSDEGFPSTIGLQVKACKAWGYICYTLSDEQEFDLCNSLKLNAMNGYTCGAADEYGFSQSFVLPDFNWIPSGFSFNMYAYLDDGSTTCNAQFSVQNVANTLYSNMAVFGLFGMGMFAAAYKISNRRLRCRIDLAAEEDRAEQEAVASTAFELMGKDFVRV